MACAARGELPVATVNVDMESGGKPVDLGMLTGSNVSLWYRPGQLKSERLTTLVHNWKPGLLRLPGGSWSDEFFWNGNGVRTRVPVPKPKSSPKETKAPPTKAQASPTAGSSPSPSPKEKPKEDIAPAPKQEQQEPNAKREPAEKFKDKIDLTKFVDGKWQVDYSSYAPGFRLKAVPGKPGQYEPSDFHGNVDVRTLHEFAKKSGARAIVTVNLGTGTPEVAAEWVRWAKKEGYDVAYWEVGNELDGQWELGHIMPDGRKMTGADYAARFKEFAAAIKAADPTAKVGGPASSNDELVFVEDFIRDAGPELDFVSFHTYPVLGGRITEAERFSKAVNVGAAVEKIRGWIRQYQPAREGQIEIGVSEWHKQVMETRPTVDISSGLWACIFLGTMVDSGISFANVWDFFSQTETGGHGIFDKKDSTPRAVFHALTLWRNHMLPVPLKVTGGDETLRLFATRAADGADVALLAVNTSPDQARTLEVRLGDKRLPGKIEAVRFTDREYFWDPHSGRALWSLEPKKVTLALDSDGRCEIPPRSALVLKLSDSEPASNPTEDPGAPEISFVLPKNAPSDLPVEGFIVVRKKGSDNPWGGVLPEVSLSVEGPATADKTAVPTGSSVGTFILTPGEPGTVHLRATTGDLSCEASLEIVPVEERQEILWSFSDAASVEGMKTSYRLSVDQQVRPNQSVAAVTLENDASQPEHNTLLELNSFPPSLDKKRIGGVVANLGLSPDFTGDTSGASIQVVLQSNNDHWIPLASIPLAEIAEGKKEHVLKVADPAIFEAMPQLYSLRFMLNASHPLTGVIYIDDIGFLLRSNSK